MVSRFFLYILFYIIFSTGISHAADISLNVDTNAVNDIVYVTVSNNGKDEVKNLQILVELGESKIASPIIESLSSRSFHQEQLKLELPNSAGSYPLTTYVLYDNDGAQFSTLNVGSFNYLKEEQLKITCPKAFLELKGKSKITIRNLQGLQQNIKTKLILPKEIEIIEHAQSPNAFEYVIQTRNPGFNANYQVYQIYESYNNNVNALQICPLTLKSYKTAFYKSQFSTSFLIFVSIFSFILSFYFYCLVPIAKNQRLVSAATRSFGSICISSFLFASYRLLSMLSDFLLPYIKEIAFKNKILNYIINGIIIILESFHFNSDDYVYFFKYSADLLYIYILFGNPLVIYYLIRPSPKSDKYWHLLESLFRLPFIRSFSSITKSDQFLLNTHAKVALRALAVKWFYLPLLGTWAVNSLTTVNNLLYNSEFTFNHINILLVELFILVDVIIFYIGYLTELPQLKNQIKSVEPTIFGWFICLVCYPPLKYFAFIPFDQELFYGWSQKPQYLINLATIFNTALWAVYVWATIALGFKSSNLTNRGIVTCGPYRHVRHPAYASKVISWIILGTIMGTMHFFLVITLIIVYALRAWTEERHLSADPEYIEYKKSVKKSFIPGII